MKESLIDFLLEKGSYRIFTVSSGFYPGTKYLIRSNKSVVGKCRDGQWGFILNDQEQREWFAYVGLPIPRLEITTRDLAQRALDELAEQYKNYGKYVH